jgi:GT2 family glycosyltransferase
MAPLTFLIVHYRRLPCLKKCIGSIEKYTLVDYEIKILRQGYQGEETESYLRLLERKENIEVIRISRKVGCAPGRSLILPKAATPFIMTLDNDIYVTQDWFEPVLQIFKSQKDVGIVGFPMYSLDGTLSNIGGTLLRIKNGLVEKTRVKMPSDVEKNFLEVDGVSSGAMVFREEVRNDFCFDPRYIIGFDYIDKDNSYLIANGEKSFV